MMEDSPKLVTVSSHCHRDKLVAGLWKLYQTRDCLDHDIRWGGQSVRAHRLLVQVFMSSEATVSRHSELASDTPHVPKMLDTTEGGQFGCLDRLVEFLYNGRVTVGENELDSLLTIAKELSFQVLVDAVEASKREQLTDTLADVAGPASRLCRRRRGRPAKGSKANSPSLSDTGKSRENAAKRERGRLGRSGKKLVVVLPAAPKRMPGRPYIRKTKPSARKNRRKEPSPDDDACEDDDPTDETFRLDSGEEKEIKVVKIKRKAAASKKPKTSPSITKAEQPLFKCQHCSHETRNKTWLQIHMARHDPTIAVFRCGSCSRQYLTEQALQHHKDVAHAGDPEVFQCPHCDYKARNKNWFQVHLSKHDTSVTIFRCDLCDKPFFSQESVERHKANHKLYKCPHCEFETPKAVSYYQHRFTVHEVDGQGRPLPRLNCDECKFTCKKRSELKYHVLAMHSGTKPFRCPQCPYVTGRKTQVNRHIKSAHENIRPHLCATCGRRCLTQSQLERHTRTHTGEKPFKCTVCEAAFGHRGSLVSHARLHVSGERPYVCHICGHSFNRRYHLKVHLKNVHKTQMDQVSAGPPVESKPAAVAPLLPPPPPSYPDSSVLYTLLDEAQAVTSADKLVQPHNSFVNEPL